MTSPPIAGPMIRLALNIAAERPMALDMSGLPTSSTANAWRTGISKALQMPSSRARRRIIHTSTTPVAVIRKSVIARTIIAVWMTMSVRRLGSASATMPPNRPSTSTGSELGDGDEPERERLVRQLEHEPGLGDVLHPGADQRGALPGVEQPVVAVAEGSQAVGAERRERHRVAPPSPPASAAGPGCNGWSPDRPASISARCSRRCARRASASPIIAAEAIGLGAQGGDLPLDARQRVDDDLAPLGRVRRVAEACPRRLASRLVLEQLADLGQREAGVVA